MRDRVSLRSLARLVLSLVAAALVLTAAQAAWAGDNPDQTSGNWMVGGEHTYQNLHGVQATIKTCSPKVSGNDMSCAYIMAVYVDPSTGYQEYMQTGWTKEGGKAPQTFREWRSDYYDGGHLHQKLWGAPGVGGTHTYKISTDGKTWNFFMDGVTQQDNTPFPVSCFPKALNDIQYFEEKQMKADGWGGTASSPCTFVNGRYSNTNRPHDTTSLPLNTYYHAVNDDQDRGTTDAGSHDPGWNFFSWSL